MTCILGVSAFYDDSAAALVVDGRIVAAAQEERFSRKKHDFRFPKHAIDYCLSEAGIAPEQIDHVAFYDKPLLKFERILETYLAYAPRGFRSFLKAMPLWMRQKLHLPREMDKGLDHKYKGRYVFLEHHESHAASAFFPSPFQEAAILTMDGVGEWATTSIGLGKGNQIELLQELHFPHSLGLLYSAFTYFTGFRFNSGEYKLMGLAPYGQPIYRDAILDSLIDLKDDGSFRMNMDFFNYCAGMTMTNDRFAALFDGPARVSESRITQREMDIAASIQVVTEEVVLRMARHVRETTGMSNLCLAGGVALNCVANGKILRERIFDHLWIQPAAGDAGGALGAAMFVWHQLLDKPRETNETHDTQFGSLLGPEYDDATIREFLDSTDAVYETFDTEAGLIDAVAESLATEKVVGHFGGRMEFGPRALGARSILGDPRSPNMQSVMNLKIKFRESFRPFAPSVLREHASDYFDMNPEDQSPYMLLVAPVNEKRCIDDQDAPDDLEGIDRLLKVCRSDVPAITHVDYSARVQTVDPDRNERYYSIIQGFYEKTGCPVVINTSFNIRGEPIVCTPEQAYRGFLATHMDVLVLGNILLRKENQPEASQRDVDGYLDQFTLD